MIPDEQQPVRRLASIEAGGSIVLYGLDVVLLGITGVILAHALGPEGKGAITIVMVVAQRATLLAALGVDVALIHFGGRGTLPSDTLASIALRLGGLLGTAAAAAAAIALWSLFRGRIDVQTLRWATPFLVVLPGATIAAFAVPLIQLRGKLLEANAVTFIGGVLGTVAAAAVLIGRRSPAFYLVLIAGAALVEHGGMVALGVRSGALSPRSRTARGDVRRVVRFGLRGHVGTLFQGLNDRFDVFVIALLVSVASVGVYSVAVAAAEVLVFVPVSVGLVLLHRGSIGEQHDLARLVGIGCRLTLLVMLPGAIGLAFLSRPLIRIVFGTAFASAARPLQLLLPGVCALGLWRVIVHALSGFGHPGAKSISAGAAAVLTVVLDLTLIPRWGINGAAAASTIAYAGAFIVAAWYARRILGVGFVDLVLPRRTDVAGVLDELRAGARNRRRDAGNQNSP